MFHVEQQLFAYTLRRCDKRGQSACLSLAIAAKTSCTLGCDVLSLFS